MVGGFLSLLPSFLSLFSEIMSVVSASDCNLRHGLFVNQATIAFEYVH